MRWKCRERFPRHHGLAIATCITARAWRTGRDSIPGSLASGFLWSRWRGKRSWYPWRMRNPQIYVSGKRPMGVHLLLPKPTMLSMYFMYFKNMYFCQLKVIKSLCESTIDFTKNIIPWDKQNTWSQGNGFPTMIKCQPVYRARVFGNIRPGDNFVKC